MRRIDKLNGLKRWWNHLAKKKFKTSAPADSIKEAFISEYENTGFIEMPSLFSKDGRPHIFQ